MKIYEKTYICTDSLNVKHFVAKVKTAISYKARYYHLSQCDNEYILVKEGPYSECLRYIKGYLTKHNLTFNA